MINIVHQKPCAELNRYIRKISIFTSDGEIKYKQKLTPSAFTYLSYNHQDIPISIFNSERIQPKRRIQIAGPKIDDNIFVEYNGRLSQILMEFSASGFYYLFHISPIQFINKLSDLNNPIFPEGQVELEKKLCRTKTVNEQIRLLEQFLIDLSANALPSINYVENALVLIDKNNGNIAVSEICNQIGISERQFNRKFQDVVGIGPKCYLKLTQLHYIIKLMQSNKDSSMQELAYRAEFYDPAHFTHRFKELTRFTPFEFINSDKHIALDFFTE